MASVSGMETHPEPSDAEAMLAAAARAAETAGAGVRLEPWFGPAMGGFEAAVFLSYLLPWWAQAVLVLAALGAFGAATAKQVQITGVRYRLRDAKAAIAAVLVPLAVLFAGAMLLDRLAGLRWAWAAGAVLVFVYMVLVVRHWNAAARPRRTP